MVFKRKLPIPADIKKMYPISEEGKLARDKILGELKEIFEGKNDKLILIIGPCSADREDAIMDYIKRLRVVQDKVSDCILIVPRIYTNKPRTTGSGYKGMLHQPDLNDEENMLKGLIAIRELHMRALNETGFACADEMLYPENHRYLSDLLSYVAVGARSSEDQQHRMTASGLDIPVGMKQKVEILKALVRGARILILDEPTAVLTAQETQELFVQLKNLKNQGYTIIFISH